VKRLLRILFNAISVMSLLLCVAAVVPWVRGHLLIDGIVWISSAGPAGCKGTWICS
jgi:hypothetical protein